MKKDKKKATGQMAGNKNTITNPAYNADRGPVHIFSGRIHGEF